MVAGIHNSPVPHGLCGLRRRTRHCVGRGGIVLTKATYAKEIDDGLPGMRGGRLVRHIMSGRPFVRRGFATIVQGIRAADPVANAKIRWRKC